MGALFNGSQSLHRNALGHCKVLASALLATHGTAVRLQCLLRMAAEGSVQQAELQRIRTGCFENFPTALTSFLWLKDLR